MRGVSSCHVSCCRLDWQRPPGEDLDHTDVIVKGQRLVANLTLGVSRLHRRPVGDRECYWGYDVTFMEATLADMQGVLRLNEDMRDHGRGHWSVVRHRQLLHQHLALFQDRHTD